MNGIAMVVTPRGFKVVALKGKRVINRGIRHDRKAPMVEAWVDIRGPEPIPLIRFLTQVKEPIVSAQATAARVFLTLASGERRVL
jgi:hypothetical protein